MLGYHVQCRIRARCVAKKIEESGNWANTKAGCQG